jgi:hypothetical protein
LLKILHAFNEIAQAQNQFEMRFRAAGEQKEVKVGHNGQNQVMEVRWLPQEGIWVGSRKLSNRYWNAFGIGEPTLQGSNSIICEINFPLEGVSRAIAGVLAKDEQGVVRVFHRGKTGLTRIAGIGAASTSPMAAFCESAPRQ